MRDKRDIDAVILHRFGNLAAQRAINRHLDVRIGRLEASQYTRQQKGCVQIRTSEHDAPRHFVRAQVGARFVVELEQLVRIGEQRLAMRRQLGPAEISLEELAADELFEPSELKADGGLRPVEALSDARHAAFLDQKNEGSQQRKF